MTRSLASLLLALTFGACGSDLVVVPAEEGDVGDDEALIAVDDTAEIDILQHGNFRPGDHVRVCASALNQRTGPSTDYRVLRVMPDGVTVRVLEASRGWYKNDWGGREGWSSGRYLCAVQPQGGSSGGTPSGGGSSGGGSSGDGLSRNRVIELARNAVGFTYWWGHGDITGSPAGACYGSCPSCSHSGGTGADCSGFAGKVWLLPEAMPLASDKHPFSTRNFANERRHWHPVSRGSVNRGDALVYNSGGAGHIFIYESGSGWGQMWTYEARGCSYGIVHNLRSAGSSYKAIERNDL